jgi:hypothetical protein
MFAQKEKIIAAYSMMYGTVLSVRARATARQARVGSAAFFSPSFQLLRLAARPGKTSSWKTLTQSG